MKFRHYKTGLIALGLIAALSCKKDGGAKVKEDGEPSAEDDGDDFEYSQDDEGEKALMQVELEQVDEDPEGEDPFEKLDDVENGVPDAQDATTTEIADAEIDAEDFTLTKWFALQDEDEYQDLDEVEEGVGNLLEFMGLEAMESTEGAGEPGEPGQPTEPGTPEESLRIQDASDEDGVERLAAMADFDNHIAKIEEILTAAENEAPEGEAEAEGTGEGETEAGTPANNDENGTGAPGASGPEAVAGTEAGAEAGVEAGAEAGAPTATAEGDTTTPPDETATTLKLKHALHLQEDGPPEAEPSGDQPVADAPKPKKTAAAPGSSAAEKLKANTERIKKVKAALEALKKKKAELAAAGKKGTALAGMTANQKKAACGFEGAVVRNDKCQCQAFGLDVENHVFLPKVASPAGPAGSRQLKASAQKRACPRIQTHYCHGWLSEGNTCTIYGKTGDPLATGQLVNGEQKCYFSFDAITKARKDVVFGAPGNCGGNIGILNQATNKMELWDYDPKTGAALNLLKQTDDKKNEGVTPPPAKGTPVPTDDVKLSQACGKITKGTGTTAKRATWITTTQSCRCGSRQMTKVEITNYGTIERFTKECQLTL